MHIELVHGPRLREPATSFPRGQCIRGNPEHLSGLGLDHAVGFAPSLEKLRYLFHNGRIVSQVKSVRKYDAHGTFVLLAIVWLSGYNPSTVPTGGQKRGPQSNRVGGRVNTKPPTQNFKQERRMDKALVEKLNGKITKIGLRIEGGGSFEVEDGRWKKYGIAPELFLELNLDADPAEEMEKLKGLIVAEIKAFVGAIEKQIPTSAPKKTKTNPVAQPAQQQATAQQQETEYVNAGQPADDTSDADVEYVTYPVSAIEVKFAESGAKFSKVKGGKWMRHGVKCWEEILAKDPVNCDLEAQPVGNVEFPKGLQAVAMVIGGTPKKVVDWA